MENDFTAGFKMRRKKAKRKKLIKALIFVFIVAIGIYVVITRTKDSIKITTSPVSASPAVSLLASLKEAVGNVLVGTKGTYAVAIKNLKTDEKYYSDEHKVFETGSLYKLWIMAVVYQQIQNGKLTEDQVLSEDVATLNDKFNIDPDSAELTEGTITFTVRDALNQMITISHNYAALLLTEKIKLSSVVTFLKENNFIESAVGTNGESPISTVSDIALYYEKLYKGEFANEQYTGEMIGLLKNQQLNDGLPKYIPGKSMVASKTGDIYLFKHDAGIVFTDKGDYIIVVMSESDNPPAAQERIALVSKAVFDYFANK